MNAPSLRRVCIDAHVEPSLRTILSATTCAWRVATSRYFLSPVTSEAQKSSGRFITLSTIVSASASDVQPVHIVFERVGIVPVALLVAASASSELAAVNAERRIRGHKLAGFAPLHTCSQAATDVR